MVTMVVPMAAVPDAVIVRELLVVVLAGLKDAVTPLGKPEADNAMVPLKPFNGLTVIVLES